MADTSTIAPPLQPRLQGAAPELRLGFRRIALVTGVFSLLVCGLILLHHLWVRSSDPLRSGSLSELKQNLLRNPRDEALKKQIRALDVQVRVRYFHERSLTRTGAWLALVSAAVSLIAARSARALQARLPQPQPEPNREELLARSARRSRWAVVSFGVLAAGAMAALALVARSTLPQSRVDLQHLNQGFSAGLAADYAPASEIEQNWPRFRGPHGLGTTPSTNFPVTWDVKSGRGIAWQARVPAPGHNSPVVWNNQVFLSGGDATNHEVFCFDADRGDLIWRRAGHSEAPRQIRLPEQTGFAASTMATDGRRVYALFATGDLMALSLEGVVVWEKSLGVPKNPHGHATSLVTWQRLLLVQFDQDQEGGSKLYAFDGATGALVWQRARPVTASWASPIVIEAAGRTQLITLGVPWIISYAPKDGAELWRAEGLANEVTPSPTWGAGLLYAISPNEKLFAFRPDGQGAVTKTHLIWSADENVPDITSPVANDELVFTVTTPGMLTCFDAKNGTKQWEQDLAMDCKASPSLVGKRLYLIGAKGAGLVLEANRQFKELARNNLGAGVLASPAFVRGKIYVRTTVNLICIGTAAEKLAQGPK